MSALRFYVAGDLPSGGTVRLKRTRRGRILIFSPDEMRSFEERVRGQAALAMKLAEIEPLRTCVSLSVCALVRSRPEESAPCHDGHRVCAAKATDLVDVVSKALSGVVFERRDQVVRTSVETFRVAVDDDESVEVVVSDLHEAEP